MNSSLPDWIGILQGLLTPAIALLAAVIAILQWRTAHLKTVLDLFDKRLAVYNSLRKSLYPIRANGYTLDEHWPAFDNAQDSATFLFGADVNAYIQELRVMLADMQMYAEMTKSATPEDLIKHHASRREIFKKFVKFEVELKNKMTPYMMMNQKR